MVVVANMVMMILRMRTMARCRRTTQKDNDDYGDCDDDDGDHEHNGDDDSDEECRSILMRATGGHRHHFCFVFIWNQCY